MRKIGKTVMILVLILFVGLTALNIPIFAMNVPNSMANEGVGSSEGMNDFTIRWVDYDTDDIVLDIKDNSVATTLRAELSFRVNAVEAEQLEIRLPMKLFVNRSGNKQGMYDISADADGNIYDTILHYHEDTSTKEIVITNKEKIADEKAFKIEFSYSNANIEMEEYASQIVNGSIHELSSTYKVVRGEQVEQGESNRLTVKHNILTIMKQVAVSKKERSFTWDPYWGEEPANAKDYFYVTYGIVVDIAEKGDPYSMPFKLTLHSEETHGGEIVSWRGGGSVSGSGFGADSFHLDENKDLILEVACPYKNSYEIKVRSTIVIAYPLDSVKDENDRLIYEYITATLEPLYQADKVEPTIMKESAYYRYKDLVFNYPKGNYGIEKTNRPGLSRNAYGVIDKLLNAKDDETIPLPEYLDTNFENRAVIRAGELTLDGANDDINNYEKKSYTTEIIDDLLIVDNGEEQIRLNENDYVFTKVDISEFHVFTNVINEDDGSVSYEEVMGADQIEPMIISYATDLNNEEWIDFAEIKYIEYLRQDCEVTYLENGHKEILEDAVLELPKDTVAIKVSIKTKKSRLRADMKVAVNLKSSERLKSFMKGKDTVELINVNTLEVKDSDGKWVNPQSKESIQGSLKDFIIERDDKVFGDQQYAQHSSADMNLRTVDLQGELIKEMGEPQKNNGYYQIDCMLGALSGFSHSAMLNEQECKDLQIFKEEKTAVFYDLLPLGASIDENSIRVGNLALNYSGLLDYSFNEIPEAKVQVEYEKNWKNSGRVMAIFKVSLPEKLENFKFYEFHDNTSYFVTSLAIDFDLIYYFDSVLDYGKTLRNLSAYQSLNDLTKFEAYPDDATNYASFSEEEKQWFIDINDDQLSGEGAPSNTFYSFDELELNDLMSSEIGISKMVMAEHDANYKKATTTLPNENYSYRIRFGKSDGSQSKNIIIYDVLEKAYNEQEEHWNGEFESIDVSNAQQKGADAIVYYAVKEDIQLTQEMVETFSGNANLEYTDVWTTTQPSDKSKITAIAVDLRKTPTGDDFELAKDERLYVTLNMKAPSENIDQKVKKKAKAYNDAWVANEFALENSQYTQEALQCSRTEVELRNANLGIDKTSDPESGTKEQPTEVHNDGDLTYDVAITNKEMSIDIEDIVMVDEIPKGLEIDFDEIKYYYNNDKQNAKPIHDEDDGLSVVRDQTKQQKLTFTIKRLEANETIHFIIPTKVIATDEAARYENQAVITEVGSSAYEIESPITYHEKKVEVANFEFLKKNKQDSSVSDAKFVLYEMNCANNVHDHRNELIEVDKNGELIQESSCFTKHGEASSGSDGKVTFVGLKTSKTYRLIEYEAPKEYVTPQGQWVLAYDQGSKSFKVTGSIGNPPGFEKPDSTWIVRNYTIEELPTTGGRGLGYFMFVGIIAMSGGGVWAYYNKKRKARSI